MPQLSVTATYDEQTYRFPLFPSDSESLSFPSLCQALVLNLDLPFSPDSLVDGTAQLRIWHIDPDGDHYHLHDTVTLHDALAVDPEHLSLRIRTPTLVPPSMATGTAVSAPTSNSNPLPQTRATTPTLLRIYQHLNANVSSNVSDAIHALHDTLRDNPDDASRLRDARHRLTRLFASFLHHLHTLPPDYRISRKLLAQLLDKVTSVANDIQLTEDTTLAIQDTIRTTAHCRFAVSLIRDKYTELVPDDPSPPAPSAPTPNTRHSRMPIRSLKHYHAQYNRLVEVAGEQVVQAFLALDRHRSRLVRRGVELPEMTPRLGRSIERTVFHVATHYVSRSRQHVYVVDDEAAEAMAASIQRKLCRAGYPEKYAKKANALVMAMVNDPDVVSAVVVWSKKRLSRLATSSTRAAGPSASAGPRRRNKVSSGSGDAWQVSRVSDPSRSGRDGSSRARSQSRSRSRSGSPSRTPSGRSDRSGQIVDPKGDRYGSSISRKSADDQFSSHIDEHDGLYDDGRRHSGHSGGEPPYVTDVDPDPFRDGRDQDVDAVDDYEKDEFVRDGDSDSSGDTSRSQWARVQMEKEDDKDTPQWYGRASHPPTERRARQSSPLPPHHVGVRDQSPERRKAEGSAQSGSVRISPHLQRARNSVDGDSREGGVYDEELSGDDADSMATNETVHSEPIDDPVVYDERVNRAKNDASSSRLRSQTPFPRGGYRSRQEESYRSYGERGSSGRGPSWR